MKRSLCQVSETGEHSFAHWQEMLPELVPEILTFLSCTDKYMLALTCKTESNRRNSFPYNNCWDIIDWNTNSFLLDLMESCSLDQLHWIEEHYNDDMSYVQFHQNVLKNHHFDVYLYFFNILKDNKETKSICFADMNVETALKAENFNVVKHLIRHAVCFTESIIPLATSVSVEALNFVLSYIKKFKSDIDLFLSVFTFNAKPACLDILLERILGNPQTPFIRSVQLKYFQQQLTPIQMIAIYKTSIQNGWVDTLDWIHTHLHPIYDYYRELADCDWPYLLIHSRNNPSPALAMIAIHGKLFKFLGENHITFTQPPREFEFTCMDSIKLLHCLFANMTPFQWNIFVKTKFTIYYCLQHEERAYTRCLNELKIFNNIQIFNSITTRNLPNLENYYEALEAQF